MKKNVVLAVIAVCLGFLSLSAVADTLTLVSTSGGSVNGINVYPYNFSVNGSSSLTSLMCLDFNREITIGETWNVTQSALALDNSQLSIQYRALALIDYAAATGYAGLSNADLQFAAWSIFDPADVLSNSGYTATSAAIVQQAMSYAADDAFTQSGFYSNFTIFSPTGDQTGWTNGVPQQFVGNVAPSAVPEPSSLLMLGSGLVGMVGTFGRRLARR